MWWITALHIALVAVYALLVPTYRAPDEPEHFDLVREVARTASYPDFDGLALNEQTIASYRAVKLGRLNLAASDAEPRADRMAFDQLAPDEPSAIPNRMPQHPPLYYAATGALFAGASSIGMDTAAHDLAVTGTRLMNLLLVVWIPLITYMTAIVLTMRRVVGIAASLVPLAIPQFIHIEASVNNDALWILLASLATLAGALVLRGNTGIRTALFLGLIVGLALLTKAFALVLPFWVMLLYAVAWRRGASVRIVVTRVIQAGFVALVAGGWWWIRNVVVFGKLQVSVPIYKEASGAGNDVGFWLKTFVIWFTESFWGWMGFFEAKLPVIVIGLASVAAVATLVVALIPRRSPAMAIVPTEVLILLAPAIMMIPIVAYRAYAVYVDTGITAGIQGRYLFPAVTAFAVIAAAVWVEILARQGEWVPLGVLAGVALMQIAAFMTILSVFYAAPGAAVVDRFRTWLAWSTVPQGVSLASLGMVVILGVVTASLLWPRRTTAV